MYSSVFYTLPINYSQNILFFLYISKYVYLYD